jgi:hypothetical protein
LTRRIGSGNGIPANKPDLDTGKGFAIRNEHQAGEIHCTDQGRENAKTNGNQMAKGIHVGLANEGGRTRA